MALVFRAVASISQIIPTSSKTLGIERAELAEGAEVSMLSVALSAEHFTGFLKCLCCLGKSSTLLPTRGYLEPGKKNQVS